MFGDISHMSNFDLVMLLKELSESKDQSDIDFAKNITDEIKKRKPVEENLTVHEYPDGSFG